jgi:hypothetical protein
VQEDEGWMSGPAETKSIEQLVRRVLTLLATLRLSEARTGITPSDVTFLPKTSSEISGEIQDMKLWRAFRLQ